MSNEIRINGNYEEIIFSDEAVKSAGEYWTEFRMENAIPIEALSVASTDSSDVSANQEMHGAATPINADTSASPFSAGGKLFLTLGGKDYSCSAQFCGDNNLVLTAAHCVKAIDSGEWADNLIFVRAYKDLSHQHAFQIKAAIVNTNWNDAENACLDYAFVLTTKRSDVAPLTYKINVDNADVTAFGYPQNYGGGYVMKRTDGPTSLYQNNLVLMKGNLMKGGATGGAWVEQGGNTVIGVSAFFSPDANEYIYSSLLTPDFENLANRAKELVKEVIKVTEVRYFTLKNEGSFVAHIQVKWSSASGESGTYEGDGYHDICIHAERTLDLLTTGIAEGAKVRLKAEVVWGDDVTATEEYTYSAYCSGMAVYEVSGTTQNVKLKQLSCQ